MNWKPFQSSLSEKEETAGILQYFESNNLHVLDLCTQQGSLVLLKILSWVQITRQLYVITKEHIFISLYYLQSKTTAKA